MESYVTHGTAFLEQHLCRGEERRQGGGGGGAENGGSVNGAFMPPMLLDPEQMIETISNTTGNSVAFQYSAPRILARDFDGIRMDITYKDVELQTSLAKSLGMPMLMAPMGLQV